MKALLLDVGNSRIKWGVSDNGLLSKTGNIAQQKIREQGLGVLTKRLPRNVDAAMASNVAGPSFATRLAGIVHAHCNRDLHFAKTAQKAYGVTNSYSQPRRMGVDRWVAMIGARAELHSTCIVIDAGTAVTVDAIDSRGRHLGGQIFPGLTVMASALHAETSELPLATGRRKATYQDMNMFTSNTRDAIVSGALNAVTGAIERAIRTMRSNAYRPKVVLTGGDASRILQGLDGSPIHRPHLVLQGLLHILTADQAIRR